MNRGREFDSNGLLSVLLVWAAAGPSPIGRGLAKWSTDWGLVDLGNRGFNGPQGPVEALLRDEGFSLFNSRGSHRTSHRDDDRILTLVCPHGGRKTCQPADVRKILEAVER